jgi:hypothetical protein
LDKVIMAAEIVAAGIPTVGAVAPMVAEVEVDSAAEIAAGSAVVAFKSLVSQLVVTSVEIPARFRLNQTEVSPCFVATASRALTKAALIANPRLIAVRHDSKIISTIDHDLLAHQVRHRSAQA